MKVRITLDIGTSDEEVIKKVIDDNIGNYLKLYFKIEDKFDLTNESDFILSGIDEIEFEKFEKVYER